jgi:hypothetical protein
MSYRRTRKPKQLAVQAAELAVAVPQIIAHRVTRMAIAGTSPSARDRKEFYRMGAEKIMAFNECWNAMALQAFRANQQLALSFMQSLWFPWASPQTSLRTASKQLGNAALGVAGKGMAPVHRRAVANAKRLGRTQLR